MTKLDINPLLMKNQIPCIIIDDDPDAADQLKEYIDNIPQLFLQQLFLSPVEFLGKLNSLETGTIIFLDINMPSISGIDLAEMLLPKSHHIIFTSAHSEYAVQSYELNAKNYLPKPISEKKFIMAVAKLLGQIHPSADNSRPDIDESFFLKTGENGQKLRLFHRDVLFIQAATNYIFVVTKTDKHLSLNTLSAISERLKLSSYVYHRVHKSYLINADQVEKIVGNTAYIEKHEIPISPLYKEDFMAYIESRQI